MDSNTKKILTIAVVGFLVFVVLIKIIFFANKDAKNLDTCEKNVRTLAKAVERYAKDHNGEYPAILDGMPHMYLKEIPTCPAAGRDTYTSSYHVEKGYYSLGCNGKHHVKAGVPEDYPKATSKEGVKRKP